MHRTTAHLPKRSRGGLTLVEVLVILAIIVVVVGLLLPARRSSGGAARRAQCANNLRNIAIAISAYATTYGVLPPASTWDDVGRPLHGWRTLTLPQQDQEALYRTVDLAKPWDDSTNALAREARLTMFVCPESKAAKDETTYLATLEPGGCLVPGKPRRVGDVTDGTANTLMAIEAGDDRAVPWMSPRDADESVMLRLSAAKLHHAGGTNAAFADGAVRFLRATTSPPILRALTTAAGGEVVPADSYSY